MSKKRKKRKKRVKKYSIVKKSKMLLKGSIMKWSVFDPLSDDGEICDCEFTHTSAVARLMLDELKALVRASMSKVPMLWHADVDMEFNSPISGTYYRGFELGIDGLYAEAEGDYRQQIQNVFDVANMDQYVNTHVRMEIKGNGNAKSAFSN